MTGPIAQTLMASLVFPAPLYLGIFYFLVMIIAAQFIKNRVNWCQAVIKKKSFQPNWSKHDQIRCHNGRYLGLFNGFGRLIWATLSNIL